MTQVGYWLLFDENDDALMEAEIVERVWYIHEDGEPSYCYNLNTWHVDVGQVHTGVFYSIEEAEKFLVDSGYSNFTA